MDTQKSLWGDLPAGNLPTPYTILKEQASILTSMTNGLLIGEVQQSQFKEFFDFTLKIKVPALNSYTISILDIRHEITPYPVDVGSLILENSLNQECHNEEEYKQVLGEILSSPEVKRIISTLLSNIRADQPA